MDELQIRPGDLAMAWPTPSARRGETFMLFGYLTGVKGNVVSAGVNEFIIPNDK